MRKAIKIFDTILAVICVIAMTFVTIGGYKLPNDLTIYDNKDIKFSKIYQCKRQSKAQSVDYQMTLPATQTIELAGIIPVKNVSVTTKKTKTVMVSGEAFGIKLYTDGVIVVGTQAVETVDKKINPAEDAGIQVGDIIVSINGTMVYSSDDVERILNDNNGQEYYIKVKRDSRYRTFILKPVYSDREERYKAGMWVRDSTAGIGTITYYDTDSGYFGALGHQINDVDTNEIMPLLEGEAVTATVTSVQKGRNGTTGSLICDFGDQAIGRLLKNNEHGIFGAFAGVSENAVEYPVAAKQEVKKGKAKMLCTIDASGVQEFDIEITHISYSPRHNQQNMVIKVTDEKLLEKTGGIVQGMSGSPIIQNSKLVGAVTHVIINNPKKGYAIFAENMINQK